MKREYLGPVGFRVSVPSKRELIPLAIEPQDESARSSSDSPLSPKEERVGAVIVALFFIGLLGWGGAWFIGHENREASAVTYTAEQYFEELGLPVDQPAPVDLSRSQQDFAFSGGGSALRFWVGGATETSVPLNVTTSTQRILTFDLPRGADESAFYVTPDGQPATAIFVVDEERFEAVFDAGDRKSYPDGDLPPDIRRTRAWKELTQMGPDSIWELVADVKVFLPYGSYLELMS